MFHRHPLIAVAAAAAIGILLDKTLAVCLVPAETLTGLMIWVGVFGVVALAVWKIPERHRWLVTGLLVMPIAAIRHRVVADQYDRASVFRIVSETPAPAVLEGTIDRPIVLRRHPLADSISRTDQSPWQTMAEVRIDSARVGQQQHPFDGRALVVVEGRLGPLLPGDRVRILGWANRFMAPTNPGASDLRDVYRRRGLHIRVNVDSVDQIIRLNQNPDTSMWNPALALYRPIAAVARRSRDILLRHTDANSGPLAVALVIGQRDFVDHRTRDALLVTGTAHLLSVSGLHLAIIVILASVTATLLRLPVFPRIVWVLLVCVLYTAITGGRPPVMRACILVVALLFSLLIRRPSQPLNSLALAAIVLLLFNPELLFSIGVQLSFLAVTTLLLCGRRESGTTAQRASEQEKRLDELVQEARPVWSGALRIAAHGTGQMIWFSGCVTAISLPLVWMQFHVVSPISVVTNVVLWPLLFVSLAAGVATVLFGWMYDPLAVVPGWICHVSVLGMRKVIETATSITWGHFWLPSPPAAWVVTFYVILLALLWWRPQKSGRKWRFAWIASWLLVAVLVATRPSPLPDGVVEATFVDVGHGTSVVLRLDENDVWLYDCGRLGNDTGSSRDIDATLWSMGVTRLSGIVLSHADADHYNALPGVVRRFGVDRVITPPGMLNEAESALRDARLAIIKERIAVNEVSAGDVITSGLWPMSVMHPPPQRVEGNDNANSLVLRIDHGGKSLILPGDLEPPGTEALIRQDRPPPGGVLMAPHHGSLRMDAASVLQWARPRETIVSGGRRAKRPEVRQMLSAAGSGVHVTANQGAIRIRIDASGMIDTKSWKETPWSAR
tara:strand:+ start:148453 stop:150975 length:2523 start_codon:yes stop_codon:yes gene_type:complete